MDLFEAIKNRYSYRGEYKEIEIPIKHLKQVVEAGLQAPSGSNKQTTSFVIVNDEIILNKIREVLPKVKPIQTTSAIILCIMDKNPEQIHGNPHYEIEDCSAATENMLIAITALGYASVWLDGILRSDQIAENLGEIINLPKTKTVRIVLPIGIPTIDGPRPDKLPFDQRAWFNQYNGE
ncbi:MAG: nitroreductase [Promethearchaeota archaeon Loki_b32]|nr:MAG: nitroreductase [Candidatus Lokiarchaeota archaeon Loki_b32]